MIGSLTLLELGAAALALVLIGGKKAAAPAYQAPSRPQPYQPPSGGTIYPAPGQSGQTDYGSGVTQGMPPYVAPSDVPTYSGPSGAPGSPGLDYVGPSASSTGVDASNVSAFDSAASYLTDLFSSSGPVGPYAANQYRTGAYGTGALAECLVWDDRVGGFVRHWC